MRAGESMPRVGTPLRVGSRASRSTGAGSAAEAEAEEGDTYREGESDGEVAPWGQGHEMGGEDAYVEDEREGDMWRERVEMWKRGVVRDTHGLVAAEKGGEEAAGNGLSKTFFERLAEEGIAEEEGGSFTMRCGREGCEGCGGEERGRTGVMGEIRGMSHNELIELMVIVIGIDGGFGYCI